MNAHGLRRAEIIRMSERCNPDDSGVHVSENGAPARSSVVAAEAIFSFRREERHVLFGSPVPMAPDSDASIAIVRQDKRAAPGRLLRRNDIEHGVRFWARLGGISADGPNLVQRVHGFRRAEINVSQAGCEAGMNRPAP